MVMVVRFFRRRGVAVPFMAFLLRRFQLQRGMDDAMLTQFFPDTGLDGVRLPIGDDVHGGIAALSLCSARCRAAISFR